MKKTTKTSIRRILSTLRILKAVQKLFYTFYMDRLYRRYTLLRNPSLVCTIENTTVCNLGCRFCSHPKLNLQAEFISPQMWNLVIAQIKELPSHDFSRKELCIFYGGLGEPLLHPECLDHLRNIRQELPKARIFVDTNGVVLDSNKTEAIVRERLIDRLSISLNAPNKELYQKLTLRDQFDTVIKNIYRFVKKRNSIGSDIVISICVKDTDDNRQENASIKEEMASLMSDQDQFWVNDILNWGGLIDVHEFKSDSHLKPIDFPCYDVLLVSNISIDIHGNVYPCCCAVGTTREQSELKLGNIKEKHLADIWEHGRHLEIKRIMMKGDIRTLTTCKQCTMSSDKMHDLFFRNPLPFGPKFF